MSSKAEKTPRKLESSLQWALGSLVILVILAATGAGALIGRQAVEAFVGTRLAHDADALIAGLNLETRVIDKPLPPVYSQPLSGHYFQVRFDDGETLRSRSLWDFALEAATTGTGIAIRPGPRNQRLLLWSAGYRKQGRAFSVDIAEDVAPLLEALRHFVLLGVLFAMAAAAALLWVQKRLLRRGFRHLDTLQEEVRQVTEGGADRLREEVPAEVRPLVREFNQLLAAWSAHLERSRNAVGNLAHALKTPLHLLLQHGRDTNDAEVTEQAERMGRMVERELRQARLAGTARAGRRFAPETDIADLLATVQALHREKALNIEERVRAPAHLPLDQEDMLELIGNLLDNAAKWARTKIRITLTVEGALRLRVEDDGPGADAGADDRLLARGNRLDEATPGHGLGLAIVNDIVGLYGGRIGIDRSSALGGMAVDVEIPLDSTPP